MLDISRICLALNTSLFCRSCISGGMALHSGLVGLFSGGLSALVLYLMNIFSHKSRRAPLYNFIFHPLEVVCHYHDPQLQVGEKTHIC